MSWICRLGKNKVALWNGLDRGYILRYMIGHVLILLNNNKKSKIEEIFNSIVYAKKSEDSHLQKLYLMFWKNYLEKKNI